MSNFGNSGCGCGGCGCSVCQPANVIFQNPGGCPDPGSVTTGAHLAVYDPNFCLRRVLDAEGFIVANSTPNGYQISATTQPNVNLSNFSVTSGNTIGSLLVRNSDGIIRTLLATGANLILMTNASGQFVLQPIPTPSVPDPLAVTTANIGTLTVGNETITGGLKFTGLVVGAVANTIGLDAAGNVVIGSPSATGVQTAMFYESASSPGAGTPNGSATPGSFLIIGNQLYDSGAGLLGVTNSTMLKVLVAGKFTLNFCAQVAYTSGGTGTPAINLVINGVIVNSGNARDNISSTTDRTAFIAGFQAMDLGVNDTVQLQLSANAGSHTHVYEARIVAQKFA